MNGDGSAEPLNEHYMAMLRRIFEVAVPSDNAVRDMIVSVETNDYINGTTRRAALAYLRERLRAHLAEPNSRRTVPHLRGRSGR